jgi:uncharacterized lipoprotein YehR (DUF1307 family)
MKKTSKIAAVLMAILMVFMLAACAGETPEQLQGKWVLTSADVQGTIMTAEELATMGADFGEMSFNFVDAKNVELTGGVDAAGEVSKGTYTFEGDGKTGTITIADPDEAAVTADFLETEIQMDAGDGVILIFEKEAA